MVHRFISVAMLFSLGIVTGEPSWTNKYSEMSYFIQVKCHISTIFAHVPKMSTSKYYTKLIYRVTWRAEGRWKDNTGEVIELSEASCIPSAPIIILLMKQRSNAAWPTLESDCENTHVSLKGSFFGGGGGGIQLDQKTICWVVATFFNLLLQFSLCKSLHHRYLMYVLCIWPWPEKCGLLLTRRSF